MDAIVTENAQAAAHFTDQVDSAAVCMLMPQLVSDGGQFGLGCEKWGFLLRNCTRVVQCAKELTKYKYVVAGDGSIRE